MGRIRVLPDLLVNQIAAGEVVERPASVVKELLENAVDAGARSIDVLVEGGGRRRIRVADDGEGLDRDDALMALERHATSKLSAPADLAAIATLGFRGEALPSIASVSRMTLTSSRDGAAGTRVEVEGGRVRKVEPAGHPRGTTLDVRDLFYNTPARAKFLKTPATELGHISDLVAAASVAIPGIRLRLSHEGRILLDVPASADVKDRLARAYGTEWQRALAFESTRGPFTARGLILPPSAAITTRRLQHIYVNGRLVKDRLIGHAILSACEGYLPKDRHAAVFLFLECPSASVDVNVHPAKAEVRFTDSRLAHDLVRDAIASALSAAVPVTAIGSNAAAAGDASRSDVAASAVHEAVAAYMAGRDGTGEDRPGGFRLAGAGARPAAPVLPDLDDGPVALAHYRESYILAADREGLLIVDQHAAHERILYERLWADLRPGAGPAGSRQSLLFPATVAVPGLLEARLDEAATELDRLGFTVEPFGDGTLLVREVPGVVPAGDPGRLVADLLDQMAGDPVSAEPGRLLRREKLAATVACHAAIKVRMPLSSDRMNYLIKELFRTSTPLKCPHGRPSVLRFPQETIEKGFDRR